MTQQCNDLREHLLASLPQPENRAAYREETAALLAKHARALRWLKIAAITLLWVAVALTILTILWQGNYLHLGASNTVAPCRLCPVRKRRGVLYGRDGGRVVP